MSPDTFVPFRFTQEYKDRVWEKLVCIMKKSKDKPNDDYFKYYRKKTVGGP